MSAKLLGMSLPSRRAEEAERCGTSLEIQALIYLLGTGTHHFWFNDNDNAEKTRKCQDQNNPKEEI